MRALVLMPIIAVLVATGAGPGPGTGLAPATAAAQGAAAGKSTAAMLGDKYFRVEFEADRARGGRARLTGYVYNDHGLGHARVRLLVESLDAAGRVTATTVGYVDSLVPLKGRAYFEVPVERPGESYRVSVPYFDWIDGRGPRDRF